MYYALVISDSFSKYLLVKAVRNTKTGPVISALNEITTHIGLPKRIVTDRGTAFTSKSFEDYCTNNDIQHIKTAVRTPRANGQFERANQLVLSILRTSDGKTTDWDLKLRDVQWIVNSQKNATTGYSPNEVTFGFNLRDLTHNKIVSVLQRYDDETSVTEKQQQASINITSEREKWKQRYDQRHIKPTIYVENDLVVVAHEPPATGVSRKLEPLYRGPYIITKVLGNDRYLVADIPGMQVTQRRFESVFSSDKMKRWCQNCPELNENDDDDIEDDTDAGVAELSTSCISISPET